MLLGSLERRERFEIAHIADVLTEIGIRRLGQAGGGLELPASRQNDWSFTCWPSYRKRGISSRPAHGRVVPLEDADNGIVAHDVDFAIMNEQSIGERSQTMKRLGIISCNRLIAQIPRRHH